MAILVFIVGAILGSFYLVVGERFPKKENFITSRSKCDHCGHKLAWYELIPIFSYVFLLGKCLNCGKKIRPIHIIVEIITGLLFLAGYLYFGLSLKYIMYLIAISVAIITFISDFEYMVILDEEIIIGSILLLIVRYFEVGLLNTLYSLFYGILLFIIMLLIKLLGDILFKKESLGGGDIKLCVFIGILLGYPGIGFRLGLIALIFAAFLALPYAVASLYLNKKNELPFGPFLIASSIIIFLFIDKFINLFVLFTL